MKDRSKINQLVTQFLEQNNPTGWFEELYSQAKGDAALIPWADLVVNPNLADWLTQKNLQGKGKKALVVGCGLGDDAEALSNLGYQVTGFDISPSAISWCQQRFPNTLVNYVVADALKLEKTWSNQFDFILESYTLQALPESLRQQIMSNLANYLAPEGILLIICRGRNLEEDAGVSPPWRLTKEELSFLEQLGLQKLSFDDYSDLENPPVRRFRIQYLKAISYKL
jgi:ubiquinone/menaquinone biosynthesis C-methylase UbiE